MVNWPFPSHPPIPWTPEQVREYERQQRQQIPDASM